MVRQLEHSKKNRTGALYDDLVAMVFALHAFEAYLNYVGEHLAPDIWEDEQNYFKKQPYRGFAGKVKKVLALVGLPEPDRGARPYSTVWMLKDFRDLVADGKVERHAAVVEHSGDDEPLWHPTPWDKLITSENAQRAHDDIKLFAQQLHDLAAPKIRDVWFGKLAFEGALWHGEGSSRVAT